MAAKPSLYPTPYDFSDFQTTYPATPLPGNELDDELAAIRAYLSSVADWVSTTLDDSGNIKAASVTSSMLASGIEASVVAAAEAAIADDVAAAATSAGSASTSATAAAASAAAAAASEAGVSADAGTAAAKAAEAAASAVSAATSASTATTKATDATNQANAAAGSAAAASLSETAANDWAEKLDGPVSDGYYSAHYWANQAQTIHDDIDVDVTAAAASAAAAATAQTAAENAQAYAEEWANKAEDSLVSVAAGGDGVSEYSAYHWAKKAETSLAGSITKASTPEAEAGTADDRYMTPLKVKQAVDAYGLLAANDLSDLNDIPTARTNLGLGTAALNDAGDFAAAAHNHDAAYAALGHNHDASYAALGHNHDLDYADIAHNHDASYAALAHTHAGVYQPLDATLTALAGAGLANTFPYFTAADTLANGTITAAGLALLDDADAGAQRTTLGLGTAATANTGSGNGLDADTVDGQHASAFAAAGHNHDASYAALSHNHDASYSALGHNHDADYAPLSAANPLGWELYASVTASSDAEIAFTAGFDAGYDHMFELITLVPSVDNQTLQARIYEGGIRRTDANYSDDVNPGVGDSAWALASAIMTPIGFDGKFEIYGPDLATANGDPAVGLVTGGKHPYPGYAVSGTGTGFTTNQGMRYETGSVGANGYDGVVFYFSGANITSGYINHYRRLRNYGA